MKLLKFISVFAASLSLLACSGHGGSPKSNTPPDVVHEKADCPALAQYTQTNTDVVLPPLTVKAAPNQNGIAVDDMGETWVIDGGWHHSKTGLVYRGSCSKHRVYVSFYRGDKPYGQQTYDWDETHHYIRQQHFAKP